jgi:hypothetical protein
VTVTDTSSENDWEGASPPFTPTYQEPHSVTTVSLLGLQSDGQHKIMVIIDRLRYTGLSGAVGLPQLVVCGDQSTGKSSVIVAITETPFPPKRTFAQDKR